MKPSRRLLVLLGTLAALALLQGTLHALHAPLADRLASLTGALLATLLLVALLDACWLWRLPSPTLQRQLPGTLPLGRWSDVQLTLHHSLTQACRVQLFDGLPEGMDSQAMPQQVQLQAGRYSQFSYRLRPLRRGHFHFSSADLLLPSPLGLWLARRRLDCPGQVRVYPDFARLYGAELMAVDDWLSRLGVRQKPRRGLGLEFHQLREFRDGDSLRQIDWKATARKGTPIAREYQDERDQQILFLLDCGRRMHSRDDELAHFDHALNACLLLSYVALRQGDAVGLCSFASSTPRYIAPNKGNAQLGVLLNGVYDLHSSLLPADFNQAVEQVLLRQRRRALVVVISNLRDEDDEELLGAMRRLNRRHRVLLASLREPVLDRLRHKPVENLNDALGYCGALDYLNARASLHERLLAHGLPLLEATPQQLGPQLVSRYLEWKKAGVF